VAMSEKKHVKRRPIGISPSELVHVGHLKEEQTRVHVFYYNSDYTEEKWVENLNELQQITLKDEYVNWVNIYGLSELPVIEKVGEIFGLNKLLLADLLDTKIRPKALDQDGQLILTIKVPMWDARVSHFETEQISFILSNDYLLCFQERKGDLFEPIRERLREKKGLIRHKEASYLFFLLVDVLIDKYLHLADDLQDELDHIENRINQNPQKHDFDQSQHLRSELLKIRKALIPLREAISHIQYVGKDHFESSTFRLFNHLQGNLTDCLETLDIQREVIQGLTDIYFSSQNSRMNEVIKWLTLMSTIFIPLNFIAGVYGMNFHSIPELDWPHGYWYSLGLMLLVSVTLMLYFRKKKWI
jgi:magnesium transporter